MGYGSYSSAALDQAMKRWLLLTNSRRIGCGFPALIISWQEELPRLSTAATREGPSGVARHRLLAPEPSATDCSDRRRSRQRLVLRDDCVRRGEGVEAVVSERGVSLRTFVDYAGKKRRSWE